MRLENFNSTFPEFDKTRRNRLRRELIHATETTFLQRARRYRTAHRRAYGWPFFRLGLALALASNTAFAERAPAECIQAHANAQELESLGKLLEARKEFEFCATSACPKVIQKDCKVMGIAVEKALPTLSLSALNPAGHTPSNYSLELDGVLLPLKTTKKPFAVNPGEHRVKVTAAGYPTTLVTIPVRAQEKNQKFIIQLPEHNPEASKIRNASYVLAGLGAVGFLSFVGFGISGYLDQHKLEAHETEPADRNDYRLADRMRRNYLVADVSLGISLVSLGAATYLWFAPNHTESRAKTALYLGGSTHGGRISVLREF